MNKPTEPNPLPRQPHKEDRTRTQGVVTMDPDWYDFIRTISLPYGGQRDIKGGLKAALERLRKLMEASCRHFEESNLFTTEEKTLLILCFHAAPYHRTPWERIEHLGDYITREATSRNLHITCSRRYMPEKNCLDLVSIQARIDALHICDRMTIVTACEFYWLHGQGAGLKVEGLWNAYILRWPDEFAHKAGRRRLMPDTKKRTAKKQEGK